ncbi:helix-turn-helix domain-containing protein [Paenactinomyces guangxiensis]|uniref:Tetratricopeptide repeat protein n=1 Tax=Paenactinomyces guangxiensis TaxID=1490290 RepID=A0A7W2AAM0_9BACL|nr:tetratricopeptide repeat protein [Paenactinomyces guangxiensis]MBA4496397.1 tetratricopeptide repeat protein [Paenactinomyces guangxiensis]MBH8593468.1 tetratricopeptide repeat protein [Paenactinomyces guangxiensis]
MDKPIDRITIGHMIRKKRKELRLTLDDIADEYVSASTVSNLERGIPNVALEKIAYVAKKLDLELTDLPSVLKKIDRREERTISKLKKLMTTADLAAPDEALKRIKELKVDEFSPYYALFLYLKGRCHLQKRNLSRAEGLFSDVLRLLEKDDFFSKNNVKAFCYYDLGRLFYYKNDLEIALAHTLRGIKSYDPDQEGERLIHSLMVSKAIYLEKLDRYEEARRTIDELWKDINSIKNIFVLLNMYETKALILKKQKMYHEAIELVYGGIEIARVNKMTERSFELWNTLGSIYLELQELDEAEECILTALDFKKKIEKEHLIIGAYTLLGRIHMMQGRWDESEKDLLEAVRIGAKTNNAKRFGWALITLGDLYQANEKYSKGVENYQKAAEIAKLHGFKTLQHISLLELSKCWKYVDNSEFTKSLENLFEIEVKLHQERSFL